MTLSLFNRNLIFTTLLSLAWGWQLLLAAAFILSHFPPSSSLMPQVLPEWQTLLKPEWKPLIFHLGVVAAVVSGGLLWWANRRQMESKDLLKKWQAYFGVELLLTLLWTSAAFKMVVYADRPVLAREAFVFLFVAAIACKIFAASWKDLRLPGKWPGAEWYMPAVLCILIFVPNIEGVVARMFIGEQFHHNDSFIMEPGWSYLSGQTLDVDNFSEYGIGFVVVLSRLAQAMGGFSYENVIRVMIYLTIIYYIVWYLLIRRWLGSVVLASAVMLLAVKWQMFHTGVYPFVFTYGSATPIRFLYDVVYFWCLWMHMQSGNKKWLLGAGAACGFGIFYLTTEGIYGTASFAAYILLLEILPHWRKHFRMRWLDLTLILVPVGLAFFLLALAIGHYIVTPRFWGNIAEFANYFLSGFGLEPIYKSLVDHNYLASLMGFVIPVVYLFTALIFLSRLAMNVAGVDEWLIVVLSLYGLATYHYYVERSAVTSYYAVGLPFVFILGAWAKIAISFLKENRRTMARSGLLALSAWALLTNHLFLAYPNMINLSSHPLTDPKVALPLPAGGPYFNHLFRNFETDLKLPVNSLGSTHEELLAESDFPDDEALIDYYHQNGRFTKDAQMIASLTAHSDEVPLISSFETTILMQADRKPFFYYLPLLISRPMSMRCFSICSIYTTDQLNKTIQKFEEAKPSYVFMERIYMINEIPRAYLFHFPSLIPLVNYVRTHYAPVAQGEYLVALKRIS